MTGLLISSVGAVFLVVAVRSSVILLYVRGSQADAHHQQSLQARENAAPLSSAIIHRLPGDR